MECLRGGGRAAGRGVAAERRVTLASAHAISSNLVMECPAVEGKGAGKKGFATRRWTTRATAHCGEVVVGGASL